MNSNHKGGSVTDEAQRSRDQRAFSSRRTLFCDLSGNHAELATSIEHAKWTVETVTTCDAANKSLFASEFEVAVIVIQASDLSLLSSIETLLNTHSLNWVAVIEPSMVEDNRIAGMISDHCFDYHSLPCDTQQLVSTLGHAYGMSILRPRPALNTLIADNETQMVGRSDAMLHLYATVKKSARVDAPVMITGETGTGKELVGRAVHNQSPRKPFWFQRKGAGPY